MPQKNEEQKLLNKRGVRTLVALAFIGIAYGFASLAIDSGSLFEYALTIFFLAWAIKSIIYAIRNS